MYYLYQFTFSSGKVYIGQTVRSMKVRLSQHRTAANRGSLLPVHCAWRKYGEPSVSIIGEYDNIDCLHAAEIAAISARDSICPNGYNVTPGGETSPASSPIVAAKIAKKAIGRKINNTERRKEIARTLWQSDEYRAKISERLRSAWMDDDYRANMSEKRKAAWVRRKASGWVVPEGMKEKLRNKVVSEETRAKMSAAAKARSRRGKEECA